MEEEFTKQWAGDDGEGHYAPDNNELNERPTQERHLGIKQHTMPKED